MFSYEICKIFKNNYFEEHLRTTTFCSSSFKLDLVDLTVFPNSNLRLVKINKSLTTVWVSNFSRLCSHASSFLRYQAQKLQNFIFSFIFSELTSKFTGKHLRLTLFFNKVASRPATLLKKDSGTGVSL